MVRYISIIKGYSIIESYIKQIKPQQPGVLLSFNEFMRGGPLPQHLGSVYDDFTANFKDIKYWNIFEHLNGLNAVQVTNNITEILNSMKKMGHTMKQLTAYEQQIICFPAWYFASRIN